jgi:hypothetical protein
MPDRSVRNVYTGPLLLPVVPPPGDGLGSNSNYFLASFDNNDECEQLLNLTVSIHITEDLVWRSSTGRTKGFSIQLNADAPSRFESVWQQYVFILSEDDDGTNTLYGGIEYWPDSTTTDLFNLRFRLTTFPKLAIPAEYLLEIRLENAEDRTVSAMNCLVVNMGMVPTVRSNVQSYAGNDGEQHINFIGADGQMRELFYRPGDGWVNNSLTQLADSTGLPSRESALAGYARVGGDQHVFYIGRDGHVHEFHIEPGGSWVDNDLIVLSGNGVGASPISALDAYAGTDGGQHVNFIGADGHVRELYLAPGKQWVNNDLTQLSRSKTTPRPDSSLDGYWGDQNGQHVNYIAQGGHVHELYIHPGAQWVDNDLIQLSKSHVIAMPNTSLSGYAWGYTESDISQHVNFIGADGHVYELLARSHENWVLNNLTHFSGDGVIPGQGSSLHSYWGPDYGQHVNFIGADGHVRELYIPSGGQWVNNDLTQLSKSIAVPQTQSSLAGFWGDGDSQHVHYIGADGHLHELYIPSGGQWVDNDLNFHVLADYRQSLAGQKKGFLAPITAFQMNIVGPVNSEGTVFSSGAGTITYSTSELLTALTNQPALYRCLFQFGGDGEHVLRRDDRRRSRDAGAELLDCTGAAHDPQEGTGCAGWIGDLVRSAGLSPAAASSAEG